MAYFDDIDKQMEQTLEAKMIWSCRRIISLCFVQKFVSFVVPFNLILCHQFGIIEGIFQRALKTLFPHDIDTIKWGYQIYFIYIIFARSFLLHLSSPI